MKEKEKINNKKLIILSIIYVAFIGILMLLRTIGLEFRPSILEGIAIFILVMFECYFLFKCIVKRKISIFILILLILLVIIVKIKNINSKETICTINNVKVVRVINLDNCSFDYHEYKNIIFMEKDVCMREYFVYEFLGNDIENTIYEREYLNDVLEICDDT